MVFYMQKQNRRGRTRTYEGDHVSVINVPTIINSSESLRPVFTADGAAGEIAETHERE